MLRLHEAHALLPGSTLVGEGATTSAAAIAIERVHSDSRTVRPGDLFVALRGERFDGHAHLAQALQAGAVAVLAEHGLGDTVPGLQVPDALAALQQLAAGWRARFALPLIAVTGSNGKTTVTQMVAAILKAWLGDAAVATAGNFNNHIGVPLTLLRLRGHHRAAVLELGMNHAGEIALLAGLAAPTVALVNNAQREHLEFMAGVEAVAQENGSVIAATAPDGSVVLPADDAFTPLWRGLAAGRAVRTFALRGPADVTAQAHWQSDARTWSIALHTPAGAIDTVLHQAGEHNLRNALAAAACALAVRAPLPAVAQGLADFRAVAGRSQMLSFRQQGRSVVLVDDSYNANPDSVLAAIDVLAGLPRPRWLVLGDMAEVGAQGPQIHAEVGARARQRGIEHVWAAGKLCAQAGADRHFGTVAALLKALPAEQPQAASVLVKGSRFMRMEQVVQALAGASEGADHAA